MCQGAGQSDFLLQIQMTNYRLSGSNAGDGYTTKLLSARVRYSYLRRTKAPAAAG